MLCSAKATMMPANSQLLIFTDLDGTLLDAETYSYTPALPLLNAFKDQGIPVIPVTSKTRAEVETLRQQIGLSDPFIVENGSAVFLPPDNLPFRLPDGNDMGGYRVMLLGCQYVMARAGLKAVAQSLGRPLKGFGDLAVEQIQQLTGLSKSDAQEAKSREFSEPFLTPKNVEADRLTEAVEAMGFRVVMGDRFSHLIGGEAGKGAAVLKLRALYQSILDPGTNIVTVGLGNSPNDLDMLEHVDRPVVISGKSGAHPQLSDRGWQISTEPGPAGWAIAVRQICEDLGVSISL